jgi:hypothetical protein
VIHPGAVVAQLVAVETGPREKRVVAVEWRAHDPLDCDGDHLLIETPGWLRCPVSGCGWAFDPEGSCPDHVGVPS